MCNPREVIRTLKKHLSSRSIDVNQEEEKEKEKWSLYPFRSLDVEEEALKAGDQGRALNNLWFQNILTYVFNNNKKKNFPSTKKYFIMVYSLTFTKR